MNEIKCDVIMVPTGKVNDPYHYLFQDKTNKILYYTKLRYCADAHYQSQHLYFISDEEIKGVEWYYCPNTNKAHQANSLKIPLKHPDYRKIVATTDISMNLPLISKEWICKEYVNYPGIITNVTLEKIYTGQNCICGKSNHYDCDGTTSCMLELNSFYPLKLINNEVIIVHEPIDALSGLFAMFEAPKMNTIKKEQNDNIIVNMVVSNSNQALGQLTAKELDNAVKDYLSTCINEPNIEDKRNSFKDGWIAHEEHINRIK